MTKEVPSWPRSPSTRWSAGSRILRGTPTTGPRCEPHRRQGALGERPRRMVLGRRACRRRVHRAPPPTGAGHGRRAAVIDTERALMVHRAGRPLSYVFPPDEVGDLPTEPEPEAPGYVQVPWEAVDAWFEEGRELVHYPPEPVPPGRRPPHPAAPAGRRSPAPAWSTPTTRSSSSRPRSARSSTSTRPTCAPTCCSEARRTSYCNYKGHATWWSAVVDDTVVEDVAWTYEDPLPESIVVAGLLQLRPDGRGRQR